MPGKGYLYDTRPVLRMQTNTLLVLLLLTSTFLSLGNSATIPCQEDSECETSLLEGSKCVNAFCTNPFHYGGCLESLLPGWTRKRVCGSDDPPEAVEQGYCRQSPWEDSYMEVRIHGQAWLSSQFGAWILQILLNEILEVPVSIEADGAGLSLDFYDADSRRDVGDWYYHTQLEEGSKGDCRRLNKMDDGDGGDNEDPYVSCVHVIPETVDTQYGDGIAGSEVPFRELSGINQFHLFVPRFTAERDLSLATYLGLAGEENRLKLASTFKRPTNWKTYCEEVSLDNCATPDATANRAPVGDEEGSFFFEPGLYTGHFRATEKNDCTRTADCTGEIIDFPCWAGSHTIQQLHHLGINLEFDTGKDTIPNYMNQIWDAANATKSDVMMLFWNPTPKYYEYFGTDAEFTMVYLPPPTQTCEDARAVSGNTCGMDREHQIGSPEGACDYDVQFTKKVVAETFYELTHPNDLPAALWSPAYDAVANYQLSHLDLGHIFQKMLEQTSDVESFSSREAVCRWVVENIDRIQSYVPPTYPRVAQEVDVSENPLFIVAIILATFAMWTTVALTTLVHLRRKTETMYYTQTEFLYLLLLGSLLVAIGALLSAVPPTDAICTSIAWLVDVGFALQFFPLFVRINAINALISEGKAMRRIRLKPREHFAYMSAGVVAVCLFLLSWTFVDAPAMAFQYQLTGNINTDGENIVDIFDSCESENDVWNTISFGWQGVLLLLTTMLAAIASSVKEDLNDTPAMSRMIYVHFVFFLVRMILVVMTTEESQKSDLMGYESLVLSACTVVALSVYVLPKFTVSGQAIGEEPLPDLFLNTTIMVADIQGFSAWCSVREPVHVFKFLEQLFETFDKVADKHEVYKVETVREQYVAATGIPDAQANHAVVMAGFSLDCLKKMDLLSKHLEVKFGPDTADLALQVGLHSGPVTGGFMKGKGARFQLFGDTMTVASLMHAHGEPDSIHISQAMANLLFEAGKKSNVQARESKIHTTVKGDLQTYWLTRGRKNKRIDASASVKSSVHSSADGELELVEGIDSEQRWVNFNVELLKNHLKGIIARDGTTWNVHSGSMRSRQGDECDSIPLEEVKEIIELPTFDKKIAKRLHESAEIEIDDEVLVQLNNYVSAVAAMYNANPFHNFAHASYVMMAIEKYLNRIMAASEIEVGDSNRIWSSTHAALHEHTYGIASDPLTQFACVFSALIHDVDHPGVPNPRLAVEDPVLARLYKNRSIAEQKSFDMAWGLLMEDSYDELRGAICRDDAELKRFRELVINSLMATDLGDKELKDLRNRRWQRAFHDDGSAEEESDSTARNRKATIVIEHLIQAADVAHMCQHWSIYRKWNERLFEECYSAYISGRAKENPAESWYNGELGFLDFYIIPLAEKLRDCGVFGPTSDENLNYARNNRAMWEKEGGSIVARMLEEMQQKDLRMEKPSTKA